MSLQNISLVELREDVPFSLPGNLSVSALRVPHRDEYSETAGIKIMTSSKHWLFIPGSDKWIKNVIKEVKSVDIAFLDATFFTADELSNRKMSEVPHSLVTETIKLFKSESTETKGKIHFIHLNQSHQSPAG